MTELDGYNVKHSGKLILLVSTVRSNLIYGSILISSSHWSVHLRHRLSVRTTSVLHSRWVTPTSSTSRIRGETLSAVRDRIPQETLLLM